MGHFKEVLRSVVADPAVRVGQIGLLGPQQRWQVVRGWNETAVAVRRQPCLHELFEEQTERSGDAVAIECGGQVVSYAELEERSNRLAHFLGELGVGTESRVGLFLERTVDLVVGILGVLKAGGAYVPLDPEAPAARRWSMVQDTGAAVVLTQQRLRPRLGEAPGVSVVSLDAQWHDIEQRAPTRPTRRSHPSSLAYCIYTSGSTGRPKAVALQHDSAVAFVQWAARSFDPESLRRVVLSTSMCFDLSIFELFVPLAQGGTVLLVPSALALLEAGAPLEPTLLNTVPSAAQALLETAALPRSLRVINLAGEALRGELVSALEQRLPGVRVNNLYGPTEYTTYTTWCQVRSGERVTIGRPVSNTQVFLLDEQLEPVPIGVTGQLYIGGLGPGAWLPRAPRAHRRAFPARPLRSAGSPHVPHGRSGSLSARRSHRLPGAYGPPGQGAGLPHRAGGDRERAAALPRRERRRGHGARGLARPPPPRGLPGPAQRRRHLLADSDPASV